MHAAFLYHAIRRRHGHGHRQRRHAGGLRGDRARAAGAGRGRAAQPPPRRDRAPGRLRREAQGRRARARPPPRRSEEEWRKGTVEERLSHALVKGIDTYIDADTEEARAEARPAAAGHRRAADGRHERGRRSVRRRQDVPAAGGQVGARDEEGRRLPHAVHGGREGRDGRGRRGGARRRARSCSPRSRATCTTSARTSSASCSPATTTRSSTWA